MEHNLPPLPEREAFETWMQGDATISLEKDGHGHVDMTAELMWHAWKARAAVEAQASVQQEPFGCVTVVRKLGHADTYHFFPHPQPAYLDNASECHTLYTHPAQQAKPQPLSDSHALEILNDLEKFLDQIEDEEIADEHLAGEALRFILDRVAAIEAAHKIGVTKDQP